MANAATGEPRTSGTVVETGGEGNGMGEPDVPRHARVVVATSSGSRTAATPSPILSLLSC